MARVPLLDEVRTLVGGSVADEAVQEADALAAALRAGTAEAPRSRTPPPASPRSRAPDGTSNEPQRQAARPHPLLVAWEWQRLLEAGIHRNRAALARAVGVSRARVSQVLALLRLPQAELDEYARRLSAGMPVPSERALRSRAAGYPSVARPDSQHRL